MSTKKENKNFQFFVITLITLASVLGITSVPPAFPAIAEHFQVPIEKIGILMGIFTMPGIILTPIFGFLADKYSRKIVLIPALIVFAIAGYGCTLAESFEVLVLLRGIEGIGAASLGALNVSLIGDIYSKDKISKFTGYNNVVLSFGTAFFPVIGGYLTLISWNTVFYLPLFTILVAILFIIAFKNINQKSQNVDFKKILYSFKNKEFRIISIMNLMGYVLLIGCLFTYIPFHFKYTFGFSSKEIGIYLSVMSLSAAFSSFFLHRVINLITEKGIMILKFWVFFIVILSIPFLTPLLIYFALALFGMAFGLGFPSMQYWVLNISDNDNRASMTSVHRAVSQVGQSLGPIIFGFFASVYAAKGSVVEIFYLGALVAFLTLIITFFMLKKYIFNKSKGVSV
jgi:predicted MFS family arabinose efflux permease